MRHLSRTGILFILFISGLCGFLLSLFWREEEITHPIETIQTFHYPATFVKQLQGDPQAGEKIFKEFCTACHAAQPKIDIKAPRIGDPLFANIKHRDEINRLLILTINGVNAMPARGGCFECSDSQLREAIQYIVRESQK